ncbi:MAG: hypothetical protein QQW96_00040 [Tychonema bourrellyi B0820]|nr:hypothetical protein [Tychonema bourrellyi B0820]
MPTPQETHSLWNRPESLLLTMPTPQETHSLWNRPESLLLTMPTPTRNSLFVEQASCLFMRIVQHLRRKGVINWEFRIWNFRSQLSSIARSNSTIYYKIKYL